MSEKKGKQVVAHIHVDLVRIAGIIGICYVTKLVFDRLY